MNLVVEVGTVGDRGQEANQPTRRPLDHVTCVWIDVDDPHHSHAFPDIPKRWESSVGRMRMKSGRNVGIGLQRFTVADSQPAAITHSPSTPTRPSESGARYPDPPSPSR